MKPLRLGIAGMGFMGRMHFNCARQISDVEIVAVAVPNPKSFDPTNFAQGNLAGAETLDLDGVCVVTTEELLAADVDAISVCLPTPRHAEVSIAALQRGKHVLCEKPMALSLAECDAMIEAAQNSGKQLQIGHVLRFWPQYVAAHELIAGGDLGEIQSAHFKRETGVPTWSRWMLDASQSGGALFDLGVHDLDVARWWTGEPGQIQSVGTKRGDLPLSFHLLWMSENGANVSVRGAWNEHRADFRAGFEVTGTRGALRFDSALGESLELWQNGQMLEIEVGCESAYAVQLADFVASAQRSKPSTRVSLQDARRAVEIARQVGGSARA